MNFNSNKLRDAVILALAATAATATAQAQESASPTNLDRIEVTGSRIRKVDTETAQPVLSISRAQIEKQGFKSVADILQNISAAGSPAISRTSPLSSGEAVGGYYIDLRNLGANRTLILVNGRRLGITNDGLQDVSSIPTSMVERIEVLKDGASTLYGSDAIAGVVNIITRKNFDGAEANAYVGQWGKGGGDRQTFDFVMGFQGDRGALTAGVEYSKEDPVWAKDLWFGQSRYPTGEKTEPRPGGLSPVTQFGQFSYNRVNYTLRRDVPGLDPREFSSYRPVNKGTDASNPQLQSTLLSGVERKSAFINGRYDINDNVAFTSEVLYSDRESFAQNGGYPFQSGAFDLTADGMAADSYFNPVGQDISYTRRGWEVPRQVKNSVTTYRFNGAFEGSFEIADKFWDWDAGYLYNQNKGVQVSTGNLNTQAVAAATGPSFLNADGVVQCGTAASPIPLGFGGGQCTPWNPLVPFGYGGSNTAADENVRKFLYLPGQAISETETTSYYANLSGTLATLPAGDMGIAVGYEHRKESGTFSPDGLAQTGISTDLAGGPTGGGYSLDEFYAELQIPILADLPGARELSVNLATRYSDYNTFGDTLNSKFGFKWKPIDSLLVRGTWSEGFRAPTVADLYGGSSQTFSYYTDACDTLYGDAAGNARCAADVPAGFRQLASTPSGVADGKESQSDRPFYVGSNPLLTPETSTSKTLGVVWSPTFAQGLNIALDWWTIKIENTIIGDTETNVLADCYLRGIESRCNVGQDPTRSRFNRDADGVITDFVTTPINAGYQETEGFDLDIAYSFETQYGRFGANWLNSYVVKNELKTDNSPDSVPQQQNGFASNSGASFRLRSNLNLTWELGDFGVTWGARYYSSLKEACYFDDRCTLPDFAAPDTQGQISEQNKLGSNTFHDLQVRWNAPWNATIAIGANNVFDHYAAPAYSRPASGYSYYGGFDIGRLVYMQYKQKF
ncbi:MAG: TonB-dependent receptor [Stenotrophomonas sp.]